MRTVVKIVIAIDVGATNLRVGIFTVDGKLIVKETVRTPTTGGSLAVATKAIEIARKLLSKLPNYKIIGVGVGSIGPLDIKRGDVANAPNNPLRSFKLREPLMREFNARTYVANDCMAAVWGEYLVGAGRGKRNVAYLTISTGIGAGLVVDGHLLVGKDGNAHEVGHLVLDYKGGIRCGCGGYGHWEGIASGSAIPRTAKRLASNYEGPKTKAYELATQGKLDSPTLFKLWREDDEFAKVVINELAEVNAAGIASIINAYDPEVLTVGGSVILNNPDFLELIKPRISKYLVNRPAEVMLTPLGHDVVLIGAAYIAIKPPKSLEEIQSS